MDDSSAIRAANLLDTIKRYRTIQLGAPIKTRLTCFLLNHLQDDIEKWHLAPDYPLETTTRESEERLLHRQRYGPYAVRMVEHGLGHKFNVASVDIRIVCSKTADRKDVYKTYCAVTAYATALPDYPDKFDRGLRVALRVKWVERSIDFQVDEMRLWNILDWDDILMLLRASCKIRFDDHGEERSPHAQKQQDELLRQQFKNAELPEHIEVSDVSYWNPALKKLI